VVEQLRLKDHHRYFQQSHQLVAVEQRIQLADLADLVLAVLVILRLAELEILQAHLHHKETTVEQLVVVLDSVAVAAVEQEQLEQLADRISAELVDLVQLLALQVHL
jgi:hypothetical protein